MTEQTTTAATGPAPVAAANPAAGASRSASTAANGTAGPAIIRAGDHHPNVEAGEDGRYRVVMTATFHDRLTAAITANPGVGETIRQELKRDYPDYWGADVARNRAADFAGPGQ